MQGPRPKLNGEPPQNWCHTGQGREISASLAWSKMTPHKPLQTAPRGNGLKRTTNRNPRLPENHRNSGTLPGPEGLLYQRPYRNRSQTKTTTTCRNPGTPCPDVRRTQSLGRVGSWLVLQSFPDLFRPCGPFRSGVSCHMGRASIQVDPMYSGPHESKT